MAGLNKVVTSYDEALAGLTDGMTIIAGGFGLCGIPEGLIAQIKSTRLMVMLLFYRIRPVA